MQVSRPDQDNTLQRTPSLPVIGEVPTDLPKGARDFLQSIKNFLDARFGDKGGLDRVVSRREIESLGINQSFLNPETPVYDFTGGSSTGGAAEDNPNPPTSLEVIKMIGANKLTWTNPDTDTENIEGMQIWAANDNNISNASMMGFATWPSEEFVHNGVKPTVPWYYWIRAVKFNTLYSTWEPTLVQGGLYVPSVTGATLNETVSALLQDTSYVTELKMVANAMKLIQPSALIEEWSSSVTYDDVAIAADGAGKYYKSLQASNLNHALTDTDWWEELPLSYFDDAKPVFAVGTVDGVTTMALAGSIIADGSIIARNLAADSVTGDHINATSLITLSAGGRLDIGIDGLIRLREGGFMLVGDENVKIDSNRNSIIIAPDGGTVGQDYCELRNGDLTFYYWFDNQHHIYKSIKRFEQGINSSGDHVEIPGVWKSQPTVQISPYLINTYDPNHSDQKQKVFNEALNLTEDTLGRWSFDLVSELRIADATEVTYLGDVISTPAVSISTYHMLPHYPTVQVKQGTTYAVGGGCKHLTVRGVFRLCACQFYVSAGVTWRVNMFYRTSTGWLNTFRDYKSGHHANIDSWDVQFDIITGTEILDFYIRLNYISMAAIALPYPQTFCAPYTFCCNLCDFTFQHYTKHLSGLIASTEGEIAWFAMGE